MNVDFFHRLVKLYLKGQATPEETLLVEEFYKQLTKDGLELTPEEEMILHSKMREKILLTIRKKRKAKIYILESKKWKVAAAIILIVSIGACYFLNKKNKAPKENIVVGHYRNDIRPANGNAVLSLTNGRVVILDSVVNGQLSSVIGINANKQDGNLAYAPSKDTSYNTLSTEKGKTFHLVLSDGTKILLDATSSIKFPSNFIGKDRIVELKGQAYFEVAHNSRQPFKVKIDDKTIEVLGTHFNVDAFSKNIKVTLLEGSIKASSGNHSVMIRPGQQAEMRKDDIQLESPDMDEVMAWKNGYFKFTGNSMEEIFATLSRWYDIEVVYGNKIPDLFIANINKSEPLSRVLNLFEITKSVRFKIEGNKVTVLK